MAALEEQRRRDEAAERRQQLLARVRQLAGGALTPAGWTQRPERGAARWSAAEGDASSGDAGLEGRQGGGAGGGSKGAVAGAEAGRRPRVALLTLTGPIVLGPGSGSPLPGPGGLRGSPTEVASLPVVRALRAARLDPAVKAVVLRVDSPGGVQGGGGYRWPVRPGALPEDSCQAGRATSGHCTRAMGCSAPQSSPGHAGVWGRASRQRQAHPLIPAGPPPRAARRWVGRRL